MRSLYEGRFLSGRSNVVLVGGTGTGKTHLAIAMARQAVRSGSKGRFFNLLDLVNQLEQEPLLHFLRRRTFHRLQEPLPSLSELLRPRAFNGLVDLAGAGVPQPLPSILRSRVIRLTARFAVA